MTTLDLGFSTLRTAGARLADRWERFTIWLKGLMPTGLYARSLLIIVTPMVILQSVVAFVFMERHWNTVTYRLSAAVTQDIAALIDVYRQFPQDADNASLRRIAQDRFGFVLDFLPGTDLPPTGPKPFFSLLDQALSKEISRQIRRPFWIDTVGRSSLVEIRIQLENSVMRVFARRSAAYASNSHIFLVWMVGTSVILLGVAILFLRNQIRPILSLADAAESFGKGREVPDFRPRGAREVRRAAHAFVEMKRRVERTMETRTAMLAGVSHDLRTLLTRFKLELALIDDGPEAAALKKDVDEMARMIEAYLAFARGDAGEASAPTDMASFLEELKADAERHGHKTSVVFHGHPIVAVKPAAFKRCLANLVSKCGALRALDRHHRAPRPPLSVDHDRRRRARHSAHHAGRGIQAVHAARRRTQPGRRRHRPRPRDRPRHRAFAWRRHHAGRQPIGGSKGDGAGAGVGKGAPKAAHLHMSQPRQI
jgi:two-component system osmolarity sensor histidine kinase EnvZ